MSTTEHHEILCDLCAAEPPRWLRQVPELTEIMTTVDTQTGAMERALSAGRMGFCNRCRRALEEGVDAAVRRQFKANARLRAMTGKARRIAQRHARKLWGRILPQLAPAEPLVLGEHPTDGITTWHDAPTNPEAN